MGENEFMTVDEISEKLRLSSPTIIRFIECKKLKAKKFGRQYRIAKIDFEEFLEKSTVVKAFFQ